MSGMWESVKGVWCKGCEKVYKAFAVHKPVATHQILTIPDKSWQIEDLMLAWPDKNVVFVTPSITNLRFVRKANTKGLTKTITNL